MSPVLRTLVVDDTVTWRKLVSDAVGSFGDVELIGTAPHGELAIRRLRSSPVDLVFCDVHMPRLDGVETLRIIRREFPKTVVVMMSGISTRNAESTIKALQMGAAGFIRKPDGTSAEENRRRLAADVEKMLRVARVKVTMSVTMPAKGLRPAPARTPESRLPPPPRHVAVAAVGVSTGGPEALSRLVPALPGSLSVPVVCVQHMPPEFTRSLAESLNRKSALRVVEAAEGDEVCRGTVYIAPGGRHMTVRLTDGKRRIGINDGPPENSCKPSVDVLFRSVAHAYGDKGILAVVLTGMGGDGASGVRAMKRKGCFCITQSADSCVVYGMPRAVDEAGMSDISLPIEEIAPRIVRTTNRA